MRGGARPGSGRKRTLFDEKRAITLRHQGLTYAKIAERFGASLDAIKYFFLKVRVQKQETT